jgi:hypothetical protein
MHTFTLRGLALIQWAALSLLVATRAAGAFPSCRASRSLT